MKRMKTHQTGKSSVKLIAGIVLVAAIGVGVWQSPKLLTPSHDDSDDGLFFDVTSGPLTVSLVESGTVRPLDPVTIISEVEGRRRIIFLAEEGSRVKPGDLLVQMDSSDLEDNLSEREIRVENAQADLVQAQQNLEVTRNQSRSDISRAELDVEFARLDLKKYWEGEYPNELARAQDRIRLSNQELEQARDRYEGSQRLYESQYISASELNTDRLAYVRRVSEFETAQNELRLLVKYTRFRQLRQLLSDIEQAVMSLERIERKAAADEAQAQASLSARQLELLRQQERLSRIRQQIENCSIVSPDRGTVVYASRGRWDEPLREGSEVGENDEIIYLPAEGSMMVEFDLHETLLDAVNPGQPVQITVDALPGRVYRGSVQHISNQPDAQMNWLNPDLVVYTTRIYFDTPPRDLRTGMSCRVEVLIDHYDEVVQVPVQAVIREDGQTTVYLDSGNGELEPRPVTIGLDNQVHLAVLEGLSPGDRVSLVPPLAAGAMRSAANPEQINWSEGEVLAAREASEPRPRLELSEEDQQVVQAISFIIDNNFLDRTPFSEALKTEARGVYDAVQANTEPTISDELRTALADLQAQMQRRGAGS